MDIAQTVNFSGYSAVIYNKIKGADYVMHEAFCLDSEENIFHAYEKNHSTVKSASEVIEDLNKSSGLLGMSEYSNSIFDVLEKADHEVMVVEYGSYFNARQQQKENLQTVVELMKENPQTTAKQIAEKMGLSTSGVQQRITKLRKQNRIRFVGKGGKGYWEVLEE